MANSNIVGVKYIGGKPRKEDNVAGTGAVWVPGQVINFTQDVASKLVQFNTVWELVGANPNGETYLGTKKNPALAIEPVPFININEMDAASLVAYARVEFNKVLDAGTEIEALRTQVHGLMVNQTLDEAETANQKEQLYNISLQVTESERDAFLAGDLILRLVPKLDEGPAVPVIFKAEMLEGIGLTDLQPSNVIVLESNNNIATITKPTTEPLNEQSTTTETANAQVENQDEPLEVTLAKLDKKALREMCKELGIPVSNTMSEVVLRNKLLAKAGAK